MKKNKKIISVQANAIEKINLKTDTTLELLLEGKKRGYKIFWYETKGLSLLNKKVIATGNFVNLFSNSKKNRIWSFQI